MTLGNDIGPQLVTISYLMLLVISDITLRYSFITGRVTTLLFHFRYYGIAVSSNRVFD